MRCENCEWASVAARFRSEVTAEEHILIYCPFMGCKKEDEVKTHADRKTADKPADTGRL